MAVLPLLEVIDDPCRSLSDKKDAYRAIVARASRLDSTEAAYAAVGVIVKAALCACLDCQALEEAA